MQVGDLVTGTEKGTYEGSIGIIFGFDEDDDPIVSWCNDTGSDDFTPGCGEFRNQVMILNATR